MLPSHRLVAAALTLAICACSTPSPAPVGPVAPCDAPVTAPPPRLDVESSIDAIRRMLDDWHDAAAKADEARYFGHLDEASIFLGTDATERWTKPQFLAYAHPHFQKGKAWTFRAVRRDVSVDSADLAHFDEDLDTVGLGPARGSGVVVRRDGRWLIVQYNLAITVPNERFDTVKLALAPTTSLLSAPKSELAWAILEGSWLGVLPDGTRVEEHWTSDAAGDLVGMGRSVKDGAPVFFEHLRIETSKRGTELVASPRGGPSTRFKLATSAGGELVFENLGHDPKRIAYKPEGDALHVTVTDKAGGDERWTLRRALLLPASAK